jgi:hypothetical protein
LSDALHEIDGRARVWRVVGQVEDVDEEILLAGGKLKAFGQASLFQKIPEGLLGETLKLAVSLDPVVDIAVVPCRRCWPGVVEVADKCALVALNGPTGKDLANHL